LHRYYNQHPGAIPFVTIPRGSLAQDLKKLINQPSLCDLEIETKTGVVYANKAILNARIDNFVEKFLVDTNAKRTIV
jgi:hypothetical protein